MRRQEARAKPSPAAERGARLVVKAGGTSTVRAKLKPGRYRFYCSVDGHRQAGMEGKLTVR
jgi:uncharacterized cupredoxin-like copper-binding protein